MRTQIFSVCLSYGILSSETNLLQVNFEEEEPFVSHVSTYLQEKGRAVFPFVLAETRWLPFALFESTASLPLALVGHVVILEITTGERGNSLKVYNSGGGLRFHPVDRTKKDILFQRVMEFQGVDCSTSGLRELFSLQMSSIVKFYNWLSRKMQKNSSFRSPWQHPQQGPTCTFHCFLTYLRNNLSLEKYILLKTVLLKFQYEELLELERAFKEGDDMLSDALIKKYPEEKRKIIIARFAEMLAKREEYIR